jgi:hypothetical protein
VWLKIERGHGFLETISQRFIQSMVLVAITYSIDMIFWIYPQNFINCCLIEYEKGHDFLDHSKLFLFLSVKKILLLFPSYELLALFLFKISFCSNFVIWSIFYVVSDYQTRSRVKTRKCVMIDIKGLYWWSYDPVKTEKQFQGSYERSTMTIIS